MTICYLCGQWVDDAASSGDHVIPRTLIGKKPPKAKGFDYGGRLRTHPKCNNRFGDETHVRKALQLLGAMYDSNAAFVQPAPGDLNGHVLALNEEKLPGFGPRDFQFFGIHDARNDALASFDNPAYYAGKPQANIRKTVLCTILSVLAKSAAALLFSRYISGLPNGWNIVCVPYAGDATGADLSRFFGKNRPFSTDIRVYMNRFESASWVSIYATGDAMVLIFFVMGDGRDLVGRIQEKFSYGTCLQFKGRSLMDMVGHDWPVVRQA